MTSNAAKVGGVFIEIKGDASQFRNTMVAADATARRATANIQGAMQKVDAETRKATNSLTLLHGALATIGGVAIAERIIETADAFSLMRSRIRLVTQAGEDMYKIEEQLTQQALRNRAALKPTIDLYTRLRQARKDLTDQQAQELVDKWSKSLIISASSAAEAASSTLQFSQAMAAGVLQGQELRSVIQGNSAFATYLAEGLGVTTGELKAMGEAGELTLDRLLIAIKKAGHSIEHDFAKKALTVHQALINLETSFTRFVGLADQGAGASNQLAQWLNILANNFDTVAKVAIAMGQNIAGALAIGAVISFAAQFRLVVMEMRKAVTAGAAMGSVISFLSGPWGLALTTIAAGVFALTQAFTDTRTTAQKAADAIDEANKALEASRAITGSLSLQTAVAQYDAMQLSAKKAAEEIDAFNKTLKESGNEAKFAQYRNLLNQASNAGARLAELNDELKRAETPMWIEGYGRSTFPSASQAEIDRIKGQITQLQQLQTQLRAEAEAVYKTDPKKFLTGTDTPATSVAPPAAATAKVIQELTGYYTDLERLERSLADIRKAEAEGATGASRAALQAMLDYYDATGDVVTVLTKMRDLQGGMLTNADATMLDGLIATMEAKAVNLADFVKTLGDTDALNAALSNTYTYAGQEAEQRLTETVANATKWGLIRGVETGDWGEAFAAILTDSVREAMSNALDKLFEILAQQDWGQIFGGKSSGSTGWESVFNFVASTFSGKASGGPVKAGQRYRVGEMGSEWFVPSTNGFIVPNQAGRAPAMRSLGAVSSITVGGAQVVINGNADASVARQIASALEAYSQGLPSAIQRVVADRRVREGW